MIPNSDTYSSRSLPAAPGRVLAIRWQHTGKFPACKFLGSPLSAIPITTQYRWVEQRREARPTARASKARSKATAAAGLAMFTGIIEEIGRVLSFEKRSDVLLWDESRGEGYVLVIECATALEDAYIGCSIAVNGVCLTVTHMDAKSFTAHIAPET